jgi:hypothetical protein
MAGIGFALDVTRDIADAVEIGNRRSAEFHDETGHDGRGALSWTSASRRAAPKGAY